jgi:hypothetical protein
MPVEFKDDGKRKHQSWSAEAVQSKPTPDGSLAFSLTAYGSTKDEARENFDRIAQAAVLAICEVASEAHSDALQAAIDADNGGKP